MRATLNITYGGMSADVPGGIDPEMTDGEIRRVAVEVVRSGTIPGLHVAGLETDAFRDFVVDRLPGPAGETRLYLRPKVPFGAGAGRMSAHGREGPRP